MLRGQNGGFLAKTAFPAPPNSWAPNHVPLEYLPGIWNGAAHDPELPELRALQRQREAAGIPATLVLLAGDERHYVALDYGGGANGEPAVVFWQRDRPGVLPLAADFGAFLAGLCTEEALPPAAPQQPAAPEQAEAEEEEEWDVAPGWGTAALLGPDLDEDDEEDGSFEGAAAGGEEEEDEEIVDDGDVDIPEGELAELGQEGQEEEALPPGKKRARSGFEDHQQ